MMPKQLDDDSPYDCNDCASECSSITEQHDDSESDCSSMTQSCCWESDCESFLTLDDDSIYTSVPNQGVIIEGMPRLNQPTLLQEALLEMQRQEALVDEIHCCTVADGWGQEEEAEQEEEDTTAKSATEQERLPTTEDIPSFIEETEEEESKAPLQRRDHPQPVSSVDALQAEPTKIHVTPQQPKKAQKLWWSKITTKLQQGKSGKIKKNRAPKKQQKQVPAAKAPSPRIANLRAYGHDSFAATEISMDCSCASC